MKRYTLALAADTPLTVDVGGEFFLLDDAPSGGVAVEFFGAGNLIRNERIDSGIQGTYARPKGGFSSMRFTSVAAQVVAFYVAHGEVGVNRFSGNLDVTDRAARLLGVADVTDRAARLLGVVQGPGNMASLLAAASTPVIARTAGKSFASSFDSTTALAVGTNEVVVAPASNVAGLELVRAFSHGTWATLDFFALIAQGAAPTSFLTGYLLATTETMAALTTQQGTFKVEEPLLLSVGFGLYFRNGTTTAQGGAVRGALYSVLA